jgi:hypothetical protein
MRRVLLAALNVLAGAPEKAPGACALGALGCPAAPGPVARIVCPLPTAACPERA